MDTQRKFGMAVAAVLILVWVGAASSWADDGPEVGKPAPQFELLDANEQPHKLTDYKGAIVVLHFQSCRCPWDVAYQPFLNDLVAKYSSRGEGAEGDETPRVQFLGINANRSENFKEIKEYSENAAMAYPVLKDPGNQVADLYAAQTTPHIYVIGSDDAQTLVYKGGVEKPPLSPRQVGTSHEQYLDAVLDALVTGHELPVTSTQSIGCSIKRVKR